MTDTGSQTEMTTKAGQRSPKFLLIRSDAGARLAGSRIASPVETWEVFDHLSCRHTARQRVRWRADGSCTETVQIGLGQWLKLCHDGVPEALDVMFAPADRVDVDLLDELRAGWRAEQHTVDAYARRAAGAHDRRLAYNLGELRRWGRYDPTAWQRRLSAEQIPLLPAA